LIFQASISKTQSLKLFSILNLNFGLHQLWFITWHTEIQCSNAI
jgi:hypothetical protein